MSIKRDALLKSAKKLLWERGFEATSPRDIQDASGAGQGSFYHHFDGKLDLAAAALEEVSTEMRGLASELLDERLGGLVRVERFLAQQRDGSKGCRLGRFAMEASISQAKLRAPVEAYFRHLETLLAEALADAQRCGQLADDLIPADLAQMIIATVQGGFIVSRVRRDKEAINRAAAAALTLLRRATKSP
jgi:TetR/AcrR family transcriptional regulator, transcriptional repressor for nem operon